MAASKALQRVARIRSLEEEQQRAALESVLAEMRQLETALAECAARESHNRQMLLQAALRNDCAGRQSALAEAEAAPRRKRLLNKRLLAVRQAAELLRASFLQKRVERRQAETLVAEADAGARAAENRRAQQAADAWHSDRRRTHPTPPDTDAPRHNSADDEGIITC